MKALLMPIKGNAAKSIETILTTPCKPVRMSKENRDKAIAFINAKDRERNKNRIRVSGKVR